MMIVKPESDPEFLKLRCDAKTLLPLLSGGDTKANRLAAERIPIVTAYILKHYYRLDSPIKALRMEDAVRIKASYWDKHLPAADIDCLVTLLWEKGYSLGDTPKKKMEEPLRSHFSRGEEGTRTGVVHSSSGRLDEFLAITQMCLDLSIGPVFITGPEVEDVQVQPLLVVSPLDGVNIFIPAPLPPICK